MLCYRCKYDVEGVRAAVCPECGASLDPAVVARQEQRRLGLERRIDGAVFWAMPLLSALGVGVSLLVPDSTRVSIAGLMVLLTSCAAGVFFNLRQQKRAPQPLGKLRAVLNGVLLGGLWTVIAVIVVFTLAGVR